MQTYVAVAFDPGDVVVAEAEPVLELEEEEVNARKQLEALKLLGDFECGRTDGDRFGSKACGRESTLSR